MAQVTANGLRLEVEDHPPADGRADAQTILMVCGLGMQFVMWQEGFIRGLTERGYRVVCFDNRDCGLSEKLEHLGVPDIMTALGGGAFEPPYLLSDMAQDAVGVLDALGIDKAHVAGASMGGMIAQTIALNHPERVLSLISIMSTTGDPSLPQGTPEAMATLMAPPPDPTDREACIQAQMTFWNVIASPEFKDDQATLRAKSERNVDRQVCPTGTARQLGAIIASGARTDALPSLSLPTLVLHGADDPLVPVECGKHTASLIPGATLRIIGGMGHDFPEKLAPVYAKEVGDFVDGVRG